MGSYDNYTEGRGVLLGNKDAIVRKNDFFREWVLRGAPGGSGRMGGDSKADQTLSRIFLFV